MGPMVYMKTPSSSSAVPPWTPNVHGHPSTSRQGASCGRSNSSADIYCPPASESTLAQKALENIAKVGGHNARVRRWLESLSAYTYTLEYRKKHRQRQRRLPLPPSPTSHRRRPHRTQQTHRPRYRRHLPSPPLRNRAERPSRPGCRRGWARVPPPSRPIPTIQPLPFADDDVRDFRPLGPRKEHPTLFPAPHTFVGPIVTHDSTAGQLVGTENAAVDAGAPPGSASRPSVISLPSMQSWRNGTSPSGSDVLSDPPSRRRCRGKPSADSRLSFRTPTTARRTQPVYTHLPCDHAPGRGPAKTPSNDDSSSYSPPRHPHHRRHPGHWRPLYQELPLQQRLHRRRLGVGSTTPL